LYVFPAAVDGIISAFALTLVPDFDQVVLRGAQGLRVGGRFVVLDFKMPSNWLMSKAAPALAKLMTGPFGGTIEMTSRKPWQSLQKYFRRTQFTALFLGGAYIAAGEKA